jgi:hypothetical protein
VPEIWIPGQYTRLTLDIVNAAGTAADPGTLTLRVKAPSGTVATYLYGTAAEVVRDGVGAYHADILLDAAGMWVWRWDTTAPNAGAAEGGLTVKASTL